MNPATSIAIPAPASATIPKTIGAIIDRHPMSRIHHHESEMNPHSLRMPRMTATAPQENATTVLRFLRFMRKLSACGCLPILDGEVEDDPDESNRRPKDDCQITEDDEDDNKGVERLGDYRL